MLSCSTKLPDMPLELVRGGAKALEGELGPDSISTCALALTVGYIVMG